MAVCLQIPGSWRADYLFCAPPGERRVAGAARCRRPGRRAPRDGRACQERFRQHGERVVQGQRMMQAASDIFLGWTKGRDVTHNFYWRQLRDMKSSELVETMAPVTLTYYAHICGWTLAGPRPVRRPGRPGRLPRPRRRVRPVHRRLLRTLRRPERKGLRAVHRGGPVRTPGSSRRDLTIGRVLCPGRIAFPVWRRTPCAAADRTGAPILVNSSPRW